MRGTPREPRSQPAFQTSSPLPLPGSPLCPLCSRRNASHSIRVRKRPRFVATHDVSAPISRRAFLTFLAALPLASAFPAHARTETILDHELDLQTLPDAQMGGGFTRPFQKQFGYETRRGSRGEEIDEEEHLFSETERDADSSFTAATHGDYERVLRVHEEEDILHTARKYVSRGLLAVVLGMCGMSMMSLSERKAGRTRLPDVYDPMTIDRYFKLRPDKLLKRMALFAREILYIGSLFARDMTTERVERYMKVKDVEERVEARDRRRAEALREAITRLGPAVIKLGQAAACRPDVFRTSVIRELQKLQDDILEYFPTLDAIEVIYDELGAMPHVLFDYMTPHPIAGASLGMVFRARLEKGTWVAVKVQRPEVAEQIALDCYIAVDEYSSRLFEELDYRNELNNMLKFRKLYGSVKGIYLPRVYEGFCSKRVLVTEWVEGVKIVDDDARVRREDLGLVETGIRFALMQLLDRGFLHADMHNGNMFRTKNGYLAYIDFGLCSEVPAPVRESLVCALMHLIHGEYSRLAESLVGLALMRSDDVEIELPLLSEALRTALEPATPTERGVNRFTKFTLVGIVGKLLSLGPRFPFVFNDYFLNNLRCLGMLEGLAINADPEFSILGVVYPYVVRKILTDPAPRYRRALESLVIDSYGRMRWRRMDQLLRDVQSTAATTQFDTFRKRPLGVFADDLLESGQGLHTAFGPVLDELDIENRSDYSADLVLRFITSQSGRFLRRYIIVQYLSNIRNGMRRSIDGMVHISRPESLGLLEATAREMSDEEANVRTRQFFRRTPVSKRVRVLLRLVPEMIVPFMRMTSEMFVYLVTHFVKRMWGGMKTSGVTDTSDTNITRQRKWRAFDSTFLRRSMRTSTISTPKS